MEYNGFQYYHNSSELNYGILNNPLCITAIFILWKMVTIFSVTMKAPARYRPYGYRQKNYHLRFAAQTALLVPVNSKPVVGDQVEYEIHPGHKVKFYNFVNDITIPSIDFHTTDNYTFKNDVIMTNLIKNLRLQAEWDLHLIFRKMILNSEIILIGLLPSDICFSSRVSIQGYNDKI